MLKDVCGYLETYDVLRALGGFWQTTVNSRERLVHHSYEEHERIYYILEGESLLTVGMKLGELKGEMQSTIPPNNVHGFCNDTNEPYIILMIDVITEGGIKSRDRSRNKERVERAPFAPKYALLLPLQSKKLYWASKSIMNY